MKKFREIGSISEGEKNRQVEKRERMGLPTVETRRVHLLKSAVRALELMIDEITNLPLTTQTRWAKGSVTYARGIMRDIVEELDGQRQEETEEARKKAKGEQKKEEDTP